MKKRSLLAAIAFTVIVSSSIGSAAYADGNIVAQKHFKNAIKMSVAGNINGALNEYLKAVQIDPLYSKAYNNLGYIYRMKGKKELAIKYYNKALELNPKDDTAYTNLASVYDSLGQYDTAIEKFHKALEIDPGSITVELALEKVIKKKANAEGKTIEQVEAEVAALYPEKDTGPSYNKYLDLLNEQEEETSNTTIEEVPLKPQVELEQSTENINKETKEAATQPKNKMEAMLTDPQVGALMVLYK